jgi:hypothetical protein
MSIDRPPVRPPVVVNLGERSASKSLSGGPHQIALEDLVLDELPAINVLVLLNVRMVGNSYLGITSGLSVIRAQSRKALLVVSGHGVRSPV